MYVQRQILEQAIMTGVPVKSQRTYIDSLFHNRLFTYNLLENLDKFNLK